MANIPVFGLGGSIGSPILFPDGSVTAPAISFTTTPGTGFYNVAAGEMRWASAGQFRFNFTNTKIHVTNSQGPSIMSENATATNPSLIPNRSDETTGLGAQAVGNLSAVVGGAEITRIDANGLYMVAGDVRYSTTAGITASTTQTQGQQPLTTTVNEVATVAVANDVVTMPAATAGRWVVIINNGASTLQIFPASGDNFAGSAADASVTLASGSKVQYVTYDDAEWESI